MTKLVDRFQQFPGSLSLSQDPFTVWIDTTVKPVNQAIDAGSTVHDVHRANDFTFVGKINFNRIVHAPATMDAYVRSVWFTGEDIRAREFAGDLPLLVAEFMAVSAVTPVDAAVRSQETAVDAGCVSGIAELTDQDLTSIGNSVPRGILQSPDIGW